jgi:hypothetical protein
MICPVCQVGVERLPHAEEYCIENVVKQRDAALLQDDEARRLLAAMQGVQSSRLGYCFDECGEDQEIHTDICKRVTEFIDVTKKPKCACKCHNYRRGDGAVISCSCCSGKPKQELGLDVATYEAAKKEQAEGKRVSIEDEIAKLAAQVPPEELAKVQPKIKALLDRSEKRVEGPQKIEHCKTWHCSGTDACQCSCVKCKAIVNF